MHAPKRAMQALALARQGQSRREIAEAMGVTADTVKGYLRQARLATGEVRPDPSCDRRSVEKTRPEAAANLIEQASNPLVDGGLARAAAEEGLPTRTAAQLGQRLDTRYATTRSRAQQVHTSELLGLVSHNARRVLEAVTDEDIAQAKLKDKAIAVGIFLEKRQLLSGEPTQILTVQERGHMDDLIKMVMSEAVRRGLEIDVTPDTPRVIPKEGSRFRETGRTQRLVNAELDKRDGS